MAMNLIEVDTQSLDRDHKRIKEKTEEIRNVIKKLYIQMEELDSMWDGVANAAFCSQFAKDSQDFDALCAALVNYTNIVAQARFEYDMCDEQVQSLISQINI